MKAGTNGSACKVNNKDGVKVGTSKAGGDMSVTVPAGATTLHIYAAAWKGVSGLSLNITGATVSSTSIPLLADDGISNNSPFTLSGTESGFKYDITLSNITKETTITFTSSIAKRFVVWGATYETDDAGGGTSDPVSVTGVSLDETSITLEVGETQTLVATVTPNDATNKNVSWSSSENSTATVANGVVTAMEVGTATITVTTEDGSKTATCDVEVVPATPKSTLTFTAACNGSGTADDGVKWQITSDAQESSFDSSKGIHYGTGKAEVSYISLITSEISGTIKKVVVNASGASGTSAAISVTVGGSKFLINSQESTPIIASAADFTFTGSASGDIVVSISQGKAQKALYCKSIVVYYESNGKDEAGLAYAEADATKLVKLGAFTVPDLTNPHSLEVTYASDNTSVAEVASDGSVTLKAAGKAVITASSEETDDYNAGSASYTIYVTEHAGTEADPYTVADAKIVIDGIATKEGVYVSGIVSSIATAYNSQYGNISFNISADGSVNSQQVQAYRCKSFNGDNFTSADDVVLGATVVVTGNLKKHNSTYELDADCYLVSYEAPETPKTDISNTKATAYTVAEALALAADNNSDLTKSVYIKGVVYKADSYNSTNGTYNVYVRDEDKTEDDGKFEFFKCAGIREDGANTTTKFAEGDVQVGDKVIGYGVMTYYSSGTIWELNTGNYLVELVRPEVAVTGVTLTETATVEVGSTVTLTATVAPENASNKNITWSVVTGSDKASVADGVVTGVVAGTAVIRATSEADNTKYAECTVTVNAVDPNAKKVSFDATSDKTAEDTEKSITKSDVTIAITSGDGRFNNSSEYRIYKNAVFEVSCSAGNITKIEFTCKSGNPMSGFAEATGLDITNSVWTGNATSVSLTASNKQVQITQLIVTYKEDNRAEAGLAWNSASDIVLTVGDAFNAPSLTNPHDVTVSVESDNTELATVTAGVVSLVADAIGTATITATFAGNDDYKPATVSYTITVNSATSAATGDTYTKVTSNADLTAGEYILVYEGESETLVWNGKDAADGKVSATISNNAIAIPEGAVSLTIATVDAGYSILINGGDNNGKYVGQTSDANGMSIGETAHANSISIDADGNAVIVSGGAYLRYNASNNQNRFRYYKSSSYTGQKAIQLYKKASAIPELNWTDARTGLTEGNYYTICYPKAMTAIRGGLLFSLGGLETNSVYLVQEDAPFVAGRPYILYANDVKLEAVVEGDDAPAGSYNGLYGTLSPMDATDLSNAGATYMLYNNSIRAIGNNNSLAAGRAYIILTEIPGGAPSGQAPGRVRKMPMQGNVATDIEAIELTDKPVKVIVDGQLFIIRNQSMYDMTGRLVK